jgi:hypothetical protein
MADIKYTIVFDTKAAAEAAAKLDQAVGGLGKTAGGAQPPFSGLWKEIFAGISITAIAGKGVHEFTDFIKDSYTQALAAEKAQAALRSALFTTGREVDINAESFATYAKSLMKLTVYDDETTKGAQTLLLQLTKLNNEGINQLTRGAMGLATVYDMDLQSAATIVGKGFAGNIELLQRYIPSMREAKTVAEKKAEALKQLEIMYGRTKDAAQTAAGQFLQAKNQLHEAEEEIGKKMIPTLARLAKAAVPVIEAFFMLGEENDYITKAAERLGQTESTTEKNIRNAAAAAGYSSEQFLQMVKRYEQLDYSTRIIDKSTGQYTSALKINWAMMSQWINKGKEGPAIQQALTDEGKKHISVVEQQAKALADFRKRMAETNDEMKKGKEALDPYRKTMDDLGVTYIPKLREETEDLNKKEQDLNEAYKKGLIQLTDYERKLDEIQFRKKQIAAVISGQLIPITRKWVEEALKGGAEVDKADAKEWAAKATRLMKWLKENEKAIGIITAMTMQATSLLSAANNSYYTSLMNKVDYFYKQDRARIEGQYTSEKSQRDQLKALDKDYQKNKDAIENDAALSYEERTNRLKALDTQYEADREGLEDKFYNEEEDKKAKLEELDRKYEEKKLQVQREAARKQQLVSIAMATINTAEAVTKAITGSFPPFNYILAAISFGMGLAQIAIIKGTPLPMAKGGIFDRPTLLGGGRYEVGEAGREAVIPVEPLMKEIRAAVKEGRGDNIYLTIPIYLDGQKIDQRIIKVVKRQADLGRLTLASKAIA